MAEVTRPAGDRVKGDGSYFKVTRGGQERWLAQVYVDGRPAPVQRLLPPGADERAAKRKLRDLRDQRARGELDTTRAERAAARTSLPTVATAVETWLAAGCPGGGRRSAPTARTRGNYARQVRSALDGRDLATVCLDEWRRSGTAGLFDALAAAGWAHDSIKGIRGILSRTWRYMAVRFDDEIGDRRDPTAVDIPQTNPTRKPRAGRVLRASEIAVLLPALDGHRLLDAYAHLAIDTGMRPGEMAAASWPDFDLDATPATVTVTRAISWHPIDPLDPAGPERAVETATKTGEPGHRKLTLSARTVAALKAHKVRTAAMRLAVRGYWPDEQDGIDLRDRVFRQESGTLLTENAIGGPLTYRLRTAGLPHVSPYDLRHTAATLIEEQHEAMQPGTGYAIAARALGHVPTGAGKVTAGYVHRKLVTVDSACLDRALDSLTEDATDRPAASN